MKRRMLACLLILWVWCLCAAEVQAQGTVKGSLTVVMCSGAEPIPGGVLALHYLGQSLDGELTPEYARELEQELQSEAGSHQSVGSDGKAFFGDLEPGIYLVSQPEAAPNYRKMCPFLITVPMQQDGELLYDICACPKTERIPEDPEIPDTGQDMRWMGFLILSAAGFFAVKRLRRFGK